MNWLFSIRKMKISARRKLQKLQLQKMLSPCIHRRVSCSRLITNKEYVMFRLSDSKNQTNIQK